MYFYLLDNTILLRGAMFGGSGQFLAGLTVDASANIPVEKRCQEITMATGGGRGREVVD